MNIEEWRVGVDPEKMICILPPERFQNEFWLFSLACAQRIRHLLPESGRRAVDAQEQFIVGRASAAEVEMLLDLTDREAQVYFSGGRSPDARAYAESAVGLSPARPVTTAQVLSISSCAASAVGCATADPQPESDYDRVYQEARSAEMAAQAELLRRIVSDPPVHRHAEPSGLV